MSEILSNPYPYKLTTKVEMCSILPKPYQCPKCGNGLYLINNMDYNKDDTINYKSIVDRTIGGDDTYQIIQNSGCNRLVCNTCKISYYIDYRWLYPYPMRLREIKVNMGIV